MNKIIYSLMILGGGVLSALTLFLDQSPIILFLSTIGSGIFCSALVTFLVEKQNKKYEEKQKEAQREYALASAKHKFTWLCEREYAELSCYYSKHILKDQDDWVRENFSIEDVTKKVCNLLTKIQENDKPHREKELFEIVITPESLKASEIRSKFLVSRNLDYYKSLLESITHLLDDAPLYVSFSILNSKQIEELQLLAYKIQDIVNFSSEELLDDGSVVVFKQLLFAHADEILSTLNIPTDSTVSCQHMKKI